MDFSYYNNKGEKVHLDISVGAKWSELNIDNARINSIFSGLDDGDGLVGENEFALLETLFNRADKQIEATAGNQILENEELDEIAEQIDNGKIVLPKSAAQEEQPPLVSGTVSIQYTKQSDIYAMNRDPETFFAKEFDKLKKDFAQKYPPNEYRVEIFRSSNGRGYSYAVYPINKNRDLWPSQQLSQVNTVIRADGTELELSDYYDEEISNDENADYSKNRQSASFGIFTITDKNGQKHEIHYDMPDCSYSDVLDCRRVKQQISNFLADLSDEVIDQFIENNVESITFTSDYDDPLLADKDYYRNKMDENGNVIDIQDGIATIISPDFAPFEREYAENILVEREDGYNFRTTDDSDVSSVVDVTSPSGQVFRLNVKGDMDRDVYRQWQLPKLVDALSQLSDDVLNDLSQEVGDIKLTEGAAENGHYVRGANEIYYSANHDFDTPIISFVHELGHAIDNSYGNNMYSETPEFSSKFERFRTLARSLGVGDYNHALDSAPEFFASAYAYENYSKDEILNNHIAELDRLLAGFKESQNPQERECFELFETLKTDVNNFVASIRNQLVSVRKDETIKNLVAKDAADIIESAEQYNISWLLSGGQTIDSEMISTLACDDKGFQSAMEFYEKIAKNELYNEIEQRNMDIPEDIRQIFSQMAERLQEMRQKLTADKD